MSATNVEMTSVFKTSQPGNNDIFIHDGQMGKRNMAPRCCVCACMADGWTSQTVVTTYLGQLKGESATHSHIFLPPQDSMMIIPQKAPFCPVRCTNRSIQSEIIPLTVVHTVVISDHISIVATTSDRSRQGHVSVPVQLATFHITFPSLFPPNFLPWFALPSPKYTPSSAHAGAAKTWAT